ncbi:PAAR domain-containing protein [Paraburkholderia phosphatilytica]|uniref:PAAR domain-containing protein n=1 Tax=Paraburkholderia phosphatilytica TaxID=2282883 RepID=UPI000E4F5290|nr:PAAR domain-containing protein [Paraburkholderia phosphatilytica]
MSRRFILKGDRTDNDGVVEEGIDGSSFQGRPMAFIGAKVHCPRCSSDGVIVSDGSPRSMTVMGKTVALENDLCQCKCEPLPKLVASQSLGSRSA